MEAVATTLKWRIPVVNRDLAYFIYALVVTVFILSLIAVGRIASEVAMPILTLVVGHFFGKTDLAGKDK